MSIDFSDLYDKHLTSEFTESVASVAKRVRSGKHVASLRVGGRSAYPTWHDGAGHDRLSIFADLVDADGKNLGSTRFDVTWSPIMTQRGLHRDAKLFGQLTGALGHDKTVSIGDIVASIDGSFVEVFGRETLKVKVSDMPDAEQQTLLDNGASLESKRSLYLEENDEETYQYYAAKGYESTFSTFAISPARNAVFVDEDAIPF